MPASSGFAASLSAWRTCLSRGADERLSLISDIHLGNINGIRFARRLSTLAQRLNPDIIFIPGDLYDGTKADPEQIAAPLFGLTPPLGVFFVSGNHEEFGGATHYAEALKARGFHVLDSECVDMDGLQILGVPYEASNYPMRLRHFLMGQRLTMEPRRSCCSMSRHGFRSWSRPG